MKKFNYKKWLKESKHIKSLNEAFDANKIKDDLKNLTTQKDLPGFGPTTMVDDNVRSTLVGITLPSLEKANAPEELVKNLKILSNDFDTKDGVPYSRQPEEVQNAIKYLTGGEAQKSVDQIGDIEGGHASALKKGADTLGGSTEKIYTATAFPDDLKDSDWYKKAVEDGWKFIPKNSLTSDQEKIAKSLPTKSDGTSLEEKISNLSLDQKAKLYFMGLVRQGKIDTLPEDPKAAYMDMLYKDLANVGKDTDDDEDLRLEPEDDEYEDGTPFYGDDDDLRLEPELDETNDPEDDEEQAEYDKGWYGESLKEAASELGYLKEDYKPSHRAYDVIDKSNNDKIVAKKLSYDRALELAHTNSNYKIKATDRLAENEPPYFANQKYYDLLSDLRDEGHLHRYGVIRLQLEFGLKEKEAQEIYDEYIEDLKAEQPDAADFYLKNLNKND